MLLIDNDVQGNLTAGLGYTPAEQPRTLANLLLAAIDYPEYLDFYLQRAIIHFAAWREAWDAAEKRLMAPPRKISFDRKQFVPYLDKFGSDWEIETLFLEFLRKRY